MSSNVEKLLDIYLRITEAEQQMFLASVDILLYGVFKEHERQLILDSVYLSHADAVKRLGEITKSWEQWSGEFASEFRTPVKGWIGEMKVGEHDCLKGKIREVLIEKIRNNAAL